MAWNAPRTWNPGETVTAALMNTHLRDNLNILKTNIDDEGYLLTLLAAFAFGGGAPDPGVTTNNAGGADTQFTGYDVTVPAGHLAQPGDGLILEGTLTIGTAVETKTLKVKIGAATAVLVLSTAGVSDIVPFRMILRRRTSVSGSMTGIDWHNAPAAGQPDNYLANVGVSSVDWSIAQTLSIWGASSTVSQIRLTDYWVMSARVRTGVTV